jgi:hypothetical protein
MPGGSRGLVMPGGRRGLVGGSGEAPSGTAGVALSAGGGMLLQRFNAVESGADFAVGGAGDSDGAV